MRPLAMVAILVSACGLSAPPVREELALDPAPDGPVLEVARGETAGTRWSFGAYRHGDDVCMYTTEDAQVQGPSCGPPPAAGGSFGPLADGGDLVRAWTHVSGIVGPGVARVQVALRTGGIVESETIAAEQIGLAVRAFFLPLEPGADAVGLVALDADGNELERFQLAPQMDPGVPLPLPTPAD